MVLQDRLLGQMTNQDLKAALLPKVDGTQNLHNSLNHDTLDFFLMLSSLTSIICLKGQANYAAGNSFQDYLANCQKSSRTQYISLNLGMIEDSVVIALHPERVPGLLRAGCIPFKISQFLSLLEYSLGQEARCDNVKQIVIGVDRESLSAHEESVALRNPMFSALPYDSGTSLQVRATTGVSKKIEQLIAEAEDQDSMQGIISAGIAKKISTLMALDQNEINLEIPIAELGLDSLIAIELKNCTSGNVQATMQTSEILDMPSITVLANRVFERSALTARHVQVGMQDIDQPVPAAVEDVTVVSALPQLPLPALEASLELYLEAITPFCNVKDLTRTRSTVSAFLKPNGHGHVLQQRLVQRVADPENDAWQFDLYTNHVYLKCRGAVNPFQQFGAGFNIKGPYLSQAKEASLISAAVYEFKMRLEAGVLPPDYLNETPLCMSSLDWIFNATREPHIGIDRMRKYAGCDYMVVLRRGHMFKVELIEGGKPVAQQALEATFDEILDQSHENKVSPATLTADDRDSWTEVRELLRGANPSNETTLETIESCAFIVCLDEGSPSDPSERWTQWLLCGPSNRWSDKTLQIVVCENGVSGFVAEHSMVDGGTLQQLNEHVCQRLSRHSSSASLTNGGTHKLSNGTNYSHSDRQCALYSPLAFTLNSTLVSHVTRVTNSFTAITVPLTPVINTLDLAFPSGPVFRSYGLSPKAGAQLIIQLASRLYFGESPPSWETLSMRSFRRGRVDIIQTTLPAVIAFVDAALHTDLTVEEKCAKLLAAGQAHAANVVRASRGRGFAGHLYALQEVIDKEMGKDMPTLFTDKVYAKTRPSKIMTDCTEWTGGVFSEGGWVMPDPEHVWVHYECRDDGCHFFVKAPKNRDGAFLGALKAAAAIVKTILQPGNEQ